MNDTAQMGVWTPEEYAHHWRVSRATVYNWFKHELLQSVKVGGCRRILRQHHEAFEKRLTDQGAA